MKYATPLLRLYSLKTVQYELLTKDLPLRDEVQDIALVKKVDFLLGMAYILKIMLDILKELESREMAAEDIGRRLRKPVED